jgi:hypothetical protein
MEPGDTIDEVGADDGEVSHPDFFVVTLLDNGETVQLVEVTWVLDSYLFEENLVDLKI